MKKIIRALLITAGIISLSSVCTSAEGDVAVVTAPGTQIRKSPSAASEIICSLNENDMVTVIENYLGYSKIEHDGKTAFVSTLDISTDLEDSFLKQLELYIYEKNKPTGEDVLEYAKSFIGVPYVYGGSSPHGFDCSGFIMYVMKNFGVNMPRVSYEQMSVGASVALDELMPGDILFFRNGGHVGFYAGEGQYLHAPQTGRTVSIDPLTRDICAARRVI